MRMVLMALFMALATPTLAQNCAPTEPLAVFLFEQYAEEIVETATVMHEGQEYTFTFWANTTTGSWTVLNTSQGISCIVYAGDGYDPQKHSLVHVTFHGKPVMGVAA